MKGALIIENSATFLMQLFTDAKDLSSVARAFFLHISEACKADGEVKTGLVVAPKSYAASIESDLQDLGTLKNSSEDVSSKLEW